MKKLPAHLTTATAHDLRDLDVCDDAVLRHLHVDATIEVVIRKTGGRTRVSGGSMNTTRWSGAGRSPSTAGFVLSGGKVITAEL